MVSKLGNGVHGCLERRKRHSESLAVDRTILVKPRQLLFQKRKRRTNRSGGQESSKTKH